MSRILVIGYGNPLRGDDGVGWAIAEQLERLGGAGVEVRTFQQLTPDLAEPLGRAEHVLFIDAADRGGNAGVSWHAVQPAEIQPGNFSHHVDPSVLLTWAKALYGRAPEAQALIVDGVSFGYGEGLSDSVAALVPAAVRQARSWCERVCFSDSAL